MVARVYSFSSADQLHAPLEDHSNRLALAPPPATPPATPPAGPPTGSSKQIVLFLLYDKRLNGFCHRPLRTTGQ